MAFAADPGAFSTLRRDDVGMAGVGVAPAQVCLQPARQRRVVGVVRHTHREGPQRTELGLDRVRPGRVGRGQAQLDLVPRGPFSDGGSLVRRQVVHDHVDRCAIGSRGADRLDRGQRMIAALAAAVDTPQLVIAQAVAAMEVADAVRAVIRRRQAHRLGLSCPGRAVAGADREWSELVEREAPHRVVAAHVLDPVELGFLVRVGGVLPGPGPLEADLVLAQDLSQPFAPDHYPPLARAVGVAAQMGGEFAHAPVCERDTERAGSGGGRRDDERDVGVTNQAGTASRPLRVQSGQPPLVERMNHVPDGVLIRGDQPGNRRHRCSRRGCHDHGGAADPDRAPAAAAHDLGQPLALVIR